MLPVYLKLGFITNVLKIFYFHTQNASVEGLKTFEREINVCDVIRSPFHSPANQENQGSKTFWVLVRFWFGFVLFLILICDSKFYTFLSGKEVQEYNVQQSPVLQE